MAEASKIEWTDATWNPVTGCSVVSPGCTNCYAMKLAGTRLRNHPSRVGLTAPSLAGPVWNGEVRFNEEWIGQPLRWKRPRMIFVCAHGDLFHESVPFHVIDKVFSVMALAPQHTFQVLTKRSDRMRGYLSDPWTYRRWKLTYDPAWFPRDLSNVPAVFPAAPLPNVWLGVSVEDNERRNRIADLLDTPAAVRFVSAEPLLGPLDLSTFDISNDTEIAPLGWRWLDRLNPGEQEATRLNWVICGGESGRGARPMHPEWARSLRDQCEEAGVSFFFKQWGEWAPGECGCGAPTRTEHVAWWFNNRWDFDCLTPRASENMHRDDAPDVYRFGKKQSGRMLDGRTWDEFPSEKRGTGE